MDTQLIITLVLFAVAIGISVIMSRRSGGGDPLGLATQLVIDAEKLIKPQQGETWDQANGRKLQYVLDKLKTAYPEVDTVLLRNIIEGGVSIVKGRLANNNVSRPTITKLN